MPQFTVGSGFTGAAYFKALREAAQAAGVRIMPHARAQRLITDRSGRVIGIETLSLPPEVQAEHDRLYLTVNPHKPFDTDNVLKVMRKGGIVMWHDYAMMEPVSRAGSS